MSKKRIIADKKNQKTIAEKRIKQLFRLAEQNALSNKLNLSNRYVDLARKISMRYLVPIPSEFKRSFCKHCYQYMLPNVTCRIRINRGKIVFYCYKCKKFIRMPLGNK